MDKTNRNLLILLIILLILPVVYWWWETKPDTSILVSTQSTKGWKSYDNKTYGVHFLYPPTWRVDEQSQLEYPAKADGTHVVQPAIIVGPPFREHSPHPERYVGGLRFEVGQQESSLQDPQGSDRTTASRFYGGRSGILTTTKIKNSGEILFASFRFDEQPSGWGQDAGIVMYPMYDYSIRVQEKILETLTLTQPQ